MNILLQKLKIMMVATGVAAMLTLTAPVRADTLSGSNTTTGQLFTFSSNPNQDYGADFFQPISIGGAIPNNSLIGKSWAYIENGQVRALLGITALGFGWKLQGDPALQSTSLG